MDICLTFLSYSLIPTRLILTKVTHKYQKLTSSHAPIFMIQAIVKNGKIVPLLTHLNYNLQILNRMVKVKTFRPPQTYLIVIIPLKHPIQIRTSKLHINLRNNHHRCRMTTLHPGKKSCPPLLVQHPTHPDTYVSRHLQTPHSRPC